MKLSHYAQFTCWTSIVMLLWGMVMGWIESSFISWFAFAFFLLATLVMTLYLVGTKRPQ